jgi:hypothetical protein
MQGRWRSVPILAAIFFSSLAAAQTKLFFLGTWRVASAVVAPWVEKGRAPDASEMKSLVGKKLVFQERKIRGPRPLACGELKYTLVESPPTFLFQGAFEEMQRNDPSVDPAQVAASLGFKTASTRTLETGCANELDYHFVDENTAEFGLNDYVYTIRRQ